MRTDETAFREHVKLLSTIYMPIRINKHLRSINEEISVRFFFPSLAEIYAIFLLPFLFSLHSRNHPGTVICLQRVWLFPSRASPICKQRLGESGGWLRCPPKVGA